MVGSMAVRLALHSVFEFGIRSTFYSVGVSTVRAVVRLGSSQHCKAFDLQPQLGFGFEKN
jgi:hypothetical protein